MTSRICSRSILLGVALVAAGCSDTFSTSPVTSSGVVAQAPHLLGQPSSGRYIVVFRDNVTDVGSLASSLVSTLGGTLHFTYGSALKGFAATLPSLAVSALRLNPNVAYVEADQQMRLSTTQVMDPGGDPWGLDRIDQRELPLSGTYSYTSSGAGVHVYIIDTGIWTATADFGGRADMVFDALLPVTVSPLSDDCNGHGTHVAGTIGGATWGVAKGASLHGVRVLSCAGLGLNSQVIAGVDWVAQHHVKPAVANMSLGGGLSAALNTAVENLTNAGVFLAVAAGNDNADACLSSPAGANGVFTVAASTKTDAKASFSNWGSCVEIYAPGAAIKSAYLFGTPSSLSGTSMASPHVAGVAALYKAVIGDASAATIANDLMVNATAGVITGNPSGTPNLLLFKSTL
jgi:subtilisin family serine protease